MTKRAHGEGSLYQRATGVWVGALPLGWVKGMRRRKYVTGRTQREVREKLESARTSLARTGTVGPERLMVADFLKQWLSDTEARGQAPKTVATYRAIVSGHIEPALGRMRLSRLTPADVQALLRVKSDSGLSPRTVGMLREVLRNALNRAVRWNLVPRNSAALADGPVVVRRRFEPWTYAEVRQFLDTTAGDRLDAPYAVVAAVGLRQGEALGLRWVDVDFEQGRISVSGALQRVQGQLRRIAPKTESSRRTVVLPAFAVDRLRSHRTRQLQERLRAGSRWSDTGYVFTTTIGTPFDGPTVTRRLHSLVGRAGIRDVRFHDLRHQCASLLLAQGESPRTVMEILGHSDIRLTLQTYSHVMPQVQEEAARRLDAALAGA